MMREREEVVQREKEKNLIIIKIEHYHLIYTVFSRRNFFIIKKQN